MFSETTKTRAIPASLYTSLKKKQQKTKKKNKKNKQNENISVQFKCQFLYFQRCILLTT